PWLAGIPAVTLALTVSPELAITVAFFYFVLQQVESNVVIPLVQRHQTEVPAVVVLVAVLLGAASMGILGALIALPLAIVIHTLVTEVVVPWRTQQCTAELQDHPTSRPAVTPPV
ncbi:MAG TPA: AI-2E family transporter, partial [Tepidiformaceae bacterium]|nr:AI-2E family transporter [Tepidiformaceae bacterium]